MATAALNAKCDLTAVTPTHNAPPHFAFVSLDVACHYLAYILLLWRKCFHDENQKPTVVLEAKQNTGNGEVSEALSCAGPEGCAGGRGAPSRARRSALALAARPLTALMPAPGDGHTHEAHATRDVRGFPVLLHERSGRGVRVFVFCSHGVGGEEGDRWVRGRKKITSILRSAPPRREVSLGHVAPHGTLGTI
jgi:hypothetical protein